MSATLKKIGCVLTMCTAMVILATGCSQKPKPATLETARGALDDLRAEVREVIKDPAKSAEFGGLIDQMEQMLGDMSGDRKAHDTRMRTLIADYDATEEAFRAAFRDFNDKKRSRQERILAINEQAKGLTTAREWKAISRARAHALEAAVKAGQGL